MSQDVCLEEDALQRRLRGRPPLRLHTATDTAPKWHGKQGAAPGSCHAAEASSAHVALWVCRKHLEASPEARQEGRGTVLLWGHLKPKARPPHTRGHLLHWGHLLQDPLLCLDALAALQQISCLGSYQTSTINSSVGVQTSHACQANSVLGSPALL